MDDTIKGWPPNVNFTATCKLLRGCPGQMVDNLSEVYPVNSLPQTVEQEFKSRCKWGDCRRRFNKPESLLEHIEKCHLWSQDTRPDHVQCLWKGCTSAQDHSGPAFSHRYQIMVHMREHCESQPTVRIKA